MSHPGSAALVAEPGPSARRPAEDADRINNAQGHPHERARVSMVGFPNLFTITGPGSPSVLSNVVHSIEQHVEWISDLLVYAREHGLNRIEAEADAQREWTNQIMAIAAGTLMLKGKSWYMGANVPGKPQVFMPYIGGIGPYRDHCDAVARDGYRGFHLSRAESQVSV